MNEKELMTMDEVKELVDERMQVINRTKQIIGHSSFSKDGENKIDALTCVWKCMEFATTIDDLKKEVEESGDTEEVKKYAKKIHQTWNRRG